MLYRIADLLVEIPAAGCMASRCKEYLAKENGNADIVINDDRYNPQKWQYLSEDDNIYMQSGFQFYRQLLYFDGMMLHASAVELDGRAYLFSGPCGMGKSTHTRLWQQVFCESAQIFNDDKPALRRLDDRWYAYGTPWCGKDGINQNKKIPLGGICFLKRGQENVIRRLSQREATSLVISQTMRRFKDTNNLDLMLSHVGKLVQEIPVYELENRPEPAAAILSYETMRSGAEEFGL